jgi:hypothetical protein
MLVNFMAFWSILLPFRKFNGQFGIFCGHFGIFFPRFGVLCQEKSGNPD